MGIGYSLCEMWHRSTPHWDGQGVLNRGVPRMLSGRLCEGLQPGGLEGLLQGHVYEELVNPDNPFCVVGAWQDWLDQLGY